jgi:hypothetical protein
LADADFGGQVYHRIDASERTRDDVLVADVANNELRIFGQVFGPLKVAVHLLDQAIEHPHLVSPPKKLACYGAADKSGTSRD